MYLLAYDAENRLVQVKKNNVVMATFVYDGDGRRVQSTINGTTTTFVGSHYEVTGSQVTKYYFAGGQRVAMRKYIVPQNPTLNYLMGDHLGSTSLVTDANGQNPIETRYKPWGEVRYTTPNKTLPTQYTFTGQFSYISDEATDLPANASFGLMFYNARMYDPAIGRFTSADTVVPGGVQGWDRYAYVNNSPIRYTDPTGHFTEGAIYNYLYGQCLGKGNGDDDKVAMHAAKCASSTVGTWKADKDWWSMLLKAQTGDVLYGSATMETPAGGATVAFGFTFEGSGTDILAGITPVANAQGAGGITLDDIKSGQSQVVGSEVTLT